MGGMSRGPGKWQRAILAALEAEPEGVILAYILDPVTGDVPTHSGYSARQRAATTLAARGLCGLALVWNLNYFGARTCMVLVLPPDAPDPPSMVSSRHAERLRRLSVESGQIPRLQHLYQLLPTLTHFGASRTV